MLRKNNGSRRNANRRRRAEQFPGRSNPRDDFFAPLADFYGGRCERHRDAWPQDDREARHQASIADQLRILDFMQKIVPHAGIRELLRKLVMRELTQAQLARILRVDPARLSNWLGVFRQAARKFALAHPEWIAELAERHQWMVVGRKGGKGLDDTLV